MATNSKFVFQQSADEPSDVENGIRSVNDPELKAWIDKTLPGLRQLLSQGIGMTDQSKPSSGPKCGQDVNLDSESVAGEEDPGAALDMLGSAPGTVENICRECGGSGRLGGGAQCKACNGSGNVTVSAGGG